jgi:hypothetical protein
MSARAPVIPKDRSLAPAALPPVAYPIPSHIGFAPRLPGMSGAALACFSLYADELAAGPLSYYTRS